MKATSDGGISFWLILWASIVSQALMWGVIFTLLPHVCALLDRITS